MGYTMKPSIGMLPIDELVEIISDKINNSTSQPISAINTALLSENMQQYALIDDVNTVKECIGNTWINGSDEIQLLRDELYQLKAELIKNKVIEDTQVADGFIETFNPYNKKYDERSVAIAEVSQQGISQEIRLFETGDYLIAKKDISKPESYQNAKVEYENGNFMELNINTIDFTNKASILSKSLGQYIDNSYSFSKTINNLESGYSVGLYTTAKPISIAQCVKASRARLTIEIAKEGLYRSNPRKTNDPYNVVRVDNLRNMFMPGDKVIIGDTIVTVLSTTDKTKIVIDKNLYVEDGTPIYKCAYSAILKTYNSQYDKQSGIKTIDNNSKQIHELSLIAVIPTRTKDSFISDRLVFECNDIDNDFNTAELQIKWESTYSSILENEFIGRIYGLNLAFDKLM